MYHHRMEESNTAPTSSSGISLQILNYDSQYTPSIERLEANPDASEEYSTSLLELKKLADLGIISKEEKIRRTHLITQFMKMQHCEIEEDIIPTTRVGAIISTLDNLSGIFLTCLKDCFLGRYEVD